MHVMQVFPRGTPTVAETTDCIQLSTSRSYCMYMENRVHSNIIIDTGKKVDMESKLT